MSAYKDNVIAAKIVELKILNKCLTHDNKKRVRIKSAFNNALFTIGYCMPLVNMSTLFQYSDYYGDELQYTMERISMNNAPIEHYVLGGLFGQFKHYPELSFASSWSVGFNGDTDGRLRIMIRDTATRRVHYLNEWQELSLGLIGNPELLASKINWVASAVNKKQQHRVAPYRQMALGVVSELFTKTKRGK